MVKGLKYFNNSSGRTYVGRDISSEVDNITLYLQSINKIPLLGKEEKNLTRKIKELRMSLSTSLDFKVLQEYQEAIGKLVASNLRFVVNTVKRYKGFSREFEFLDLVEYGTLGLYRAAQKFDPDRGYTFCTYAEYWIKQAILQLFKNKRRSIKTVSFEDPIIEELDDTYLEAPDFDEGYIDRLNEVLKDLTPREKEVLMLRYELKEDGKKRTLREIGDRFGVNRERARQISNEAIEKLRRPDRIKKIEGLVSI